MTATQDDTIAELRRANAELRRERDAALSEKAALAEEVAARDAALALRNSEFGERIEQQSATIDVLKVMSASPGDPQPVFDLITRRATELCNGRGTSIFEYDGELVHFRSRYHSSRRVATASAFPFGTTEIAKASKFFAAFPMKPERGMLACRAILDRQVFHTRDTQAEPDLLPSVRDLGIRSILAIPLLRDGNAVGAFAMNSEEPGGFTDSQVALLQTFAEQAVIAISSAEMYRALQTRTSDLQQSLEYQTATSDVLKVISRSTFDLQPVLSMVAETAARLCVAEQAAIYRREGDKFHLAASIGFPPEFAARLKERGAFVLASGSPGLISGAIAQRRAVHIHDVAAVPGYPEAAVRLGKQRTSLGVPLLRKGEPVGVIVLARQRVEPFTERQIELVSTFADQAVIAIENTRLITEQREALEQQAATAEVLQVINASPGDLTPVFNAMLEKGMRLCEAGFGSLYTYDGDRFQSAAQRGVSAAYAAYRERHPPELASGGGLEEAIRSRRAVQVTDMMAERPYLDGNPNVRAMVDLGGMRTGVVVPLCKDETALGVISVFRQEVRPFSDRQVALLESFAAQAVIAMENARLIDEQREALERQTATAEVLQVINASPGELAPVFDAILEKATRLCEAPRGQLATFDGEYFRFVAVHGQVGFSEGQFAQGAVRPEIGVTWPRIMAGEQVVHMVDARETDLYRAGHAGTRRFVDVGRGRTLLTVALRKDDVLLGALTVYRQEVRGFTDRQIEVLCGFATQAVIAMENARLLTELRQRTEELARRNSEYGERIEYQSATINVLKAMSASPDNARPIFQAIVERARAICNADNANLALVDGDMLHVQATTIGSTATAMEAAERAHYMAQFPRPVDATSTFGRAIIARDVVQTPDVWADPQHFARDAAVRALVAVPLLRGGAPIGAIVLARNTPGEFSATQVELLRTFAEQAVIAISSAETFKELQRRTADLTRSVAELEALEEVLRAVNSSLDLDTVLTTIVSRAVQLSQADEGTIYEYDASEQVFVPKSAFGMSAERVAALRERRIKLGETHLGRSAILRAPVYVEDVQQDPSMPNAGDVLPGIHAVFAVPLLRNDTVIGGLVIRRRTEEGFAETIVTLMQTFSGQAVLAIENARLFQEAGRARTAAEAALVDLRRAQDRLVQSEKMASLGQLTAGIAHEIKNPLNFVNNFAELSVDLLGELKDAIAPAEPALTEKQRAEVEEVSVMLTSNLEKITEHGKRADGIVRAMLEHSRGSSGERRVVDLNGLIDEALNLAYHGARAQDQTFNVTLDRDFGEDIAPIEVNPQDMTRVFLNIFSNGFYAATRRARNGGDAGFVPTLNVTTRDADGAVEIRVRDNGTGIAADIRDKLFQPFFTTKPTGEGTGLGLSITYDIVTQQHGGSIAVDSRVGEYSEFTMQLPRYRP